MQKVYIIWYYSVDQRGGAPSIWKFYADGRPATEECERILEEGIAWDAYVTEEKVEG